MGSITGAIRRHPWRTTACLLHLIAVAATAYLATAWPDLRIAYHRRQMRANSEAVFAAPPANYVGSLAGYDWGAAGEAYEYHRGRLVELGAVAKFTHTFQHLHRSPEDTDRVWKDILARNCPPLIDANSPAAPLGDPDAVKPFELTVWCEFEDVDAWRRYIAERDVPADPPAATK
jgi:hypothetical protein